MLAETSGDKKLKVAVCAICKNENPYILEWVAYQKLVGFDHVFVYDNDSSDGTSEALIRLHEAGQITRIFWPRLPEVAPQRSAYADFLERFGHGFDWAMICDLDEFLCVDQGTVQQFIGEALLANSEASAIAIPWLVFGSSGQAAIADDLVINRFEHCELECDGAVKTLFRLNDTFNIRTHVVDIGLGKYVDNTFALAEWSSYAPTHLSFPRFGGARVHHYFTKSKGEWDLRKSLGRADRSDIQMRNLMLFDRYVTLDGRNSQLQEFSSQIKPFVELHAVLPADPLKGEVLFYNDSYMIIHLDHVYSPDLRLRAVINEVSEVVNCNVLKMKDGGAAVAINITRLTSPMSTLRLSSILNGASLTISGDELPSRKRMLKKVLQLMPMAEVLKFNLFRRISSTEAGCDYIKNVDLGEFNEFSEYGDFISMLRANDFKTIPIKDIAAYLETHGRMGQATIESFNRGPHHVGLLLSD